MSNRQLQKLVTPALGALVVFGGSWGSLSLLLGHLASFPQVLGAALGLFVIYAVLDRRPGADSD